MPFSIVRNDITKLRVDAVVNTANTSLLMGGGVCGAIFSAAGADQLQRACNKLAPIQTGEAVITDGFNLPAKYIIHTAGPVYHGGGQGEEALLHNCYINSLDLAIKNKCESIAFPLISSGIYGYPKAEALSVATNAIKSFLSENDIEASLVIFDKDAFVLSNELLGAVESFIDEHYVEERNVSGYGKLTSLKARPLTDFVTMNQSVPVAADSFLVTSATRAAAPANARLDDIVGNLDEPFSATLLRLIDATGKKDADVYRRANIDRRLFSKIRSNNNYTPSKPTVLAFAIALELTLDQTRDLLGRAGFALSRSRKFDVIVEYFISNQQFDVFEINEVLFNYDQPLLGG